MFIISLDDVVSYFTLSQNLQYLLFENMMDSLLNRKQIKQLRIKIKL